MAWLPGSNSSNLLLMRQKCFSPPLALPTDLSSPPFYSPLSSLFPSLPLDCSKGGFGGHNVEEKRRGEGRDSRFMQ